MTMIRPGLSFVLWQYLYILVGVLRYLGVEADPYYGYTTSPDYEQAGSS